MNIKQYFVIDNFFNDDELGVFEQAIALNGPGDDGIPPHGPFANQCVSNYVHIIHDVKSMELVKSKFTKCLNELFGDNFDDNFCIVTLMRVRLFLPWDVHNDLHLGDPNSTPLYNMLVPLADVESRTILFDQISNESRDFYRYKEKNNKVPNPIDKSYWDENLSMCWDDDRLYLVLLNEFPYQQRGQLVCMLQSQFHSSDNFHTKGIQSKDFLQIRINAKHTKYK